MSDVQCIIDTKLVSEKQELKQDLFNGPSFDIILLLLKGEKTASEIARQLNISLISIKLYLSRLLDGGIVVESNFLNNDNTVEKIYKLTTSKLNIINKQYQNDNSDSEQTVKYMKDTLGKAIKNIYKYPKRPYIVNSCFINIKLDKAELFKEKLQKLIKEFENLEDNESENTYSMVVAYTPYEL